MSGGQRRAAPPDRALEITTDVFRRPAGGAGFDEKTGLKITIRLSAGDARAIAEGLALGRGLALPPRRVDWGRGVGRPERLAVQPGGEGFLYFCDPRFALRSGHVPVAEITGPFGLAAPAPGEG